MAELLDVKTASIEANAIAQQVYLAVRLGVLESKRKGNRVFIVRDSFERWRKRLETRRALRAEEQQGKG